MTSIQTMSIEKTCLSLTKLYSNFTKHVVPIPQLQQHNAPIAESERLTNLSKYFVDTTLKSHMSYKHTNVCNLSSYEMSRLHTFLCDNFFEKETYRVKISLTFLRALIQNHELFYIENDDNLVSLIILNIDDVKIENIQTKFMNIKFICTNKSYRNKHLAGKLLRHVQLYYLQSEEQILSGIYSSNLNFGKFTSKLRFFYRPINPNVLISAGFNGFKEADLKISNEELKAYYKLDTSYTLQMRSYNSDQFDCIYELYINSLSKYTLTIKYEKEYLRNLLANDDVVTYCVYENGEIVDFVSYFKTYHETALSGKKQDIQIGTVFIYSTETTNIYKLIRNLLVKMYENNVDMLAMTDNMESDSIFELCKFVDSQSFDFVYLYNWNINTIPSNAVGGMICF